MAVKFHTPMLCYGEIVSFEYGGVDAEETYSSRKQVENGVAVSYDTSELLVDGVTVEDLSLASVPQGEDLKTLDPF